MQLVEEGLLDLSEPIRTYLPWFDPPAADARATAGANPVTTWHILTHTAGLADVPWDDGVTDADPRTIVRTLAQTPLSWPPGTSYRYTSDSFYLLSALVDELGDEPYAAHLRRRIFEPLGMTSTTFDPRDPGPPQAWLGGGRADHGPDAARLEEMVRLSMPGGGLWSTPGDVLQLGLAMLSGGKLADSRIVGRSSIELMTRLHTADVWDPGPPPRRPTYGLGWGLLESSRALPVGTGAFGHSGATGSLLVVDPARDLVVVHLRDEWGATMRLSHEAVAAVYGALS
jgi:CubicO group peptidase (beta-lactamase class C family)